MRMTRVFAVLLAGTATASEAQRNTARASASTTETARGAMTGGGDAARALSADVQFRGPDGQPLSGAREAELRAWFKDNPPTPSKVAPGNDSTVRTTGDVTVRARKLRGAVVGDVPPERTYTPGDIRAYGASTVEELIGALGAQVSSGRGRGDAVPVVLLNGKRVSSFAEIARLPPEAIERMEVFPEELALKYGYRPDQKVVNVVAFERFASTVGQIGYLAPTEGGRALAGLSGSYLRLRDDTRYNVDLEHNRAGRLLESERGLRQVGGDTSLGNFRTLIPSTNRQVVNATVASTILSDVSASLNGRFEATGSESLLGRGSAGAIIRNVDSRNAHLGAALGGRKDQWQWSFTGNYDRSVTETLTDRPDSAIRDDARSENSVVAADLLLAGPIVTLPAGTLRGSIRAGIDGRDLNARATIAGASRIFDLDRDRVTVQANLDVPIARGDPMAGFGLGTLTASVNAGFERLSDAGTLSTYGSGINWSPSKAFNLLASFTREEGAPTVEQLGAPPISTPNLRAFDFARGETVDVMRLSGGNRDLLHEDRRILSLGLTARPLAKSDLTFSIDYIDTRVDDPIASFPIATTQLEVALPERFGRDAGGRLQRVDGTPLNFARADQKQLRWGLSFVRPFGEQPPGVSQDDVRYFSSEAEVRRRMPPGAQLQFRQLDPGSPAARRFENMNSRLIFSVQHLVRLEDDVLLRSGTPVLDLLDGGALDARGGRSRHEIEIQAGVFRRGLGGRLTANWFSGTTVRGFPTAAGDLSFSSLATINLNLFANVSAFLGSSRTPKWANGVRLSLGATNLFNRRIDVRDAGGLTPINYQRAYLNPLGRSLNLSVRKAL